VFWSAISNTGDESDGVASKFFWDAVALHHSYATAVTAKMNTSARPINLRERVDGRTNESCNVYNMLKNDTTFYAIDPNVKYAEFEERALFNHVLGSIEPDQGRTCYMVPVGRGVRHEYQDMLRSFTCCVGTGMESHGLHGRWYLLRVRRSPVGESVRAFGCEVGSRQSYGNYGNKFSPKAKRQR
jgi:DUF1680 family protein